MRKTNLIYQTRCLSLVWILGLLLGAFLAAGSEPSFAWMRLAAQQRVSIVFFWILAVFPFLITAYAITVRRQEILLAVCFCHTFSASYIGVFLQRMFGTAGWLIEPMFLLTQNLCLPFLCWFALRHMDCKGNTMVRDHVFCLVFALLSATFQYFAVTPFLAELIFISQGR